MGNTLCGSLALGSPDSRTFLSTFPSLHTWMYISVVFVSREGLFLWGRTQPSPGRHNASDNKHCLFFVQLAWSFWNTKSFTALPSLSWEMKQTLLAMCSKSLFLSFSPFWKWEIEKSKTTITTTFPTNCKKSVSGLHPEVEAAGVLLESGGGG